MGVGIRRRSIRMTERIESENDAIKFMKKVKFALRYNATPGLPLASMYAAARDQRRAIELTNALLARDEVIEQCSNCVWVRMNYERSSSRTGARVIAWWQRAY